MLNNKEQLRYNRQLILPEIGELGQIKLKKASVLVIGSGGLGCPALLYLTSVGVGTIGIIDGDTVDYSNLHRQVLFNSNDVGKNKATVAVEKLKLQNEFVKLKPYPHFLNRTNAITLFKKYDVIIDSSDNFATRYLINDAAVITKKPLIHGSIFKFEGQVSVLNYQNGPTYRCLFPKPPDPNSIPSCNEIGVLGILPGIIGNYQALETIKIITGIGEVLSGKLLFINVLTLNHNTFSFNRIEENATIDGLLKDYNLFCNPTSSNTEISFDEFKKLMLQKSNYELVDVREEEEYAKHNIGGKNVPLSKFKFHLLNEKKKPIFVCQKGVRSFKACINYIDKLKKPAFSITGGIDGIKTYQPKAIS